MKFICTIGSRNETFLLLSAAFTFDFLLLQKNAQQQRFCKEMEPKQSSTWYGKEFENLQVCPRKNVANPLSALSYNNFLNVIHLICRHEKSRLLSSSTLALVPPSLLTHPFNPVVNTFICCSFRGVTMCVCVECVIVAFYLGIGFQLSLLDDFCVFCKFPFY